ncbi:TniQ family protein [Pseudomonas sp. DP16D-R1]|uniref:TniQ family protein n=1 Tax=Pseudomonas sp. DP16D-R1 TaxID=2075551 RepID=UPI000CD00F19|nr:TniQ family protein [Pseudomonas sp. DP16D-R1]POA74340.1 transposase [Pseudomonas sp. DP16D-R1]
MSSILFFPISMPDETLLSRITRYHFLSGNKTEAETFRDLFGVAPFQLSIIPKQLGSLASRLPGVKESNFNELLEINTYFPAYKPFIGLSKDPSKDLDRVLSDVARVPRWEGTKNSRAKICLACVQADLIESGYAYWHRAHHLPGVTACWRHGEELLQSCPNCSHPFYRKNRLLPILTDDCVCGWNAVKPANRLLASNEEREYAVFVNDILQRNLPSVDYKVLAACYRRQAKKQGFNYGDQIGTAKLFSSIRDRFGDEIISKIDLAYAAGIRRQWIRLSTTRGQIDMPLARHLLISLHLFGSAEKFEKCLAEESLLTSSEKPMARLKERALPESKKKAYREKISILLEVKPGIGMDYLWVNAYQATRWLNENDKDWLLSEITKDVKQKNSVESVVSDEDEKYAKILKEGVENLYRVTQKQVRVNISNMLALLPRKVSRERATRKSFPLVSEQLELHLESLWHFRLRRLIWTMSEIARLKLPPNSSTLKLLTTVPHVACQALINHFEWDLDNMVKEGIDGEVMLRNTGVSRQWEGPPGYDIPMGGNAYMEMIASNSKL